MNLRLRDEYQLLSRSTIRTLGKCFAQKKTTENCQTKIFGLEDGQLGWAQCQNFDVQAHPDGYVRALGGPKLC